MRKPYTLLIYILLLGQFLCGNSVHCDDTSAPNIALPTARSHYELVQSGTLGTPLLVALMNELDPETQTAAMEELNAPQAHLLLSAATTRNAVGARPSKEQILALLQQIDWTTWRPGANSGAAIGD